MKRPERPASADWLAERRTADTAARDLAASLLPELTRLGDQGGPVEAFDLGAGTGANRAYLEPRLPFATRWTLLDHDPLLLQHPRHGDGRRVLGGVERIADLLDDSPSPGAGRLITCSALLDLLDADQLDLLARTVVDGDAAGLFALSVTGTVTLTPPNPADRLVQEAFDAHQRRAGRCGPDAPTHLRSALGARGRSAVLVQTPWRLTAREHTGLLERYLSERAEVAVEHDPSLAAPAHRWLDSRLTQVQAGSLDVEVGHVDLLTVPGARG